MYPTRIALLLLSIALCSCTAPAAHINYDTSLKSRLYAWDGAGRDPNLRRTRVKHPQNSTNQHDVNRNREQVFATLRPYSAEWWAVHDEIEADYDKRLARKLVICAGCLHEAPQVDVTGTIGAD